MPQNTESWPTNRRVTVLDLKAAKKRGERWLMLTSYDALTAGVFEDSGARVLLVGDTAGMVIYGYDTTIPVTLDELLPLAAGVVRGTKRALVVGDLPFGSYQSSPQQALSSATRYLREAGVQAIKLEGGTRVVPQIEALVHAGIPVMGHLGLTPQSVHALGGHRVQGRGEAGEQLLKDAKALEEAGVFSIVLEAVPAHLGERVTQAITVPTIGIGAGPGCDAQVLVWQDMLGLTNGHIPKFVKQYANLRSVMSQAVTELANEVQSGAFPGEDQSYR